ncbi:MAG: hypothetical protein JSR47_16570 [Proteobacteria bacterium]|nr:hypothetical protein [Pseudomonadota bacterium]
MAKLPDSLSIALWIVGSTWLVALLALAFDVSTEIVEMALIVGFGAGLSEWLLRRRDKS